MKVSLEELKRFLTEQFPQGEAFGTLQALGDGWAEMRQEVDASHLRPGGTVSGPTMMALADVAMYAALLSRIGLVPLAVTTNLNINFLTRAGPGELIARCRILKLGKRLAVTDCDITSVETGELIAQAHATYSLPPTKA